MRFGRRAQLSLSLKVILESTFAAGRFSKVSRVQLPKHPQEIKSLRKLPVWIILLHWV